MSRAKIKTGLKTKSILVYGQGINMVATLLKQERIKSVSFLGGGSPDHDTREIKQLFLVNWNSSSFTTFCFIDTKLLSKWLITRKKKAISCFTRRNMAKHGSWICTHPLLVCQANTKLHRVQNLLILPFYGQPIHSQEHTSSKLDKLKFLPRFCSLKKLKRTAPILTDFIDRLKS